MTGFFASLRWYALRLQATLGRSASIAAALAIVVSVALLVHAAITWRSAATLSAADADPATPSTPNPVGDQDPLAALPATIVDLPALLQAQAARHRVTLQQASYVRTQVNAAGLLRQQANVDAVGRYAVVKAWLASLQRAAPTLALQRLEVVALDDELSVEARLTIVVLSRSTP